ncbi:hypothetical protein EDC96DRAFT_54913 [Choanephora cucurbitarum]|nr:hypothetical protein EDC96DRAFT_54913 [Choanephora cucurbitarum]
MSPNNIRLPKRTRRLRQKETDEPVIPSTVEELVSRKRQRTEMDNRLRDLFSSLNQQSEENEKQGWKESESEEEERLDLIDLDDHLLLHCHENTDTIDLENKHLLDQDHQAGIDDVMHRMALEKQTEQTRYRSFFTQSVERLEPPCLISQEEGIGQKEIHISELSATPKGIDFLFQSACLKEWYQAGWKCPHYVYQWLFQVIALAQDQKTARNAFDTLFVLWSLPGSRMETRLPHLCQQRFIRLETFKSVLMQYHASPADLADYVVSTKPRFIASTTVDLPLSQLGWMIKAFSFSVRLWSRAYTSYEIRYIVRLILQISLDKAGYLVIQDIQTAIDHCLSAMDSTTWETELKAVANDVCDMVEDGRHRFYLLNAVKTIYERSRYLRRMIGMVCLERALEAEVPGSLDYISTDQSLIQQIGQIFEHPQGFFMKHDRIDYEACYLRVAMLDAAIGTDDEDIKQDKETVLKMAAQLRNIGLQIGAKLGVMKKTMANEMIQRVWGRIFYIVGKETKVAL